MASTRSSLGRLLVSAAIAVTVAAESFAAGPAPEPVPDTIGQGEVRALSAAPATVPPATHPGSSKPVPDGGLALEAVGPLVVAALDTVPPPVVAAPVAAGKGHVSIPALGIDRKVVPFECTSTAYPGDRIYRWGCGGANNLYLFGHAHSIFKPLHDAYVRGTLEKGMTVVYSDSAGTVSTYEVIWWRVTTPDKGEFAYADQERPSMTLQTCLGDESEFRLIVRLALVD